MRQSAKTIIAAILSLAGLAGAEERNGLYAAVSKKIVWQQAEAADAEDELRHAQTLMLAVKNNSIRHFPEGTVEWTVLLRNPPGRATKYTGVEKLPPLGRIESAELQLGAIAVQAEQTVERDKIDYEVVISHDGKETLRLASTSSFATLADAAKLPEKEGKAAAAKRELRRIKGEGKTAETTPKQPEPEKGSSPPGAPTAEVKPPTAAPAQSEPSKPAAERPPSAQPAFDFFNLGGKKLPDAK